MSRKFKIDRDYYGEDIKMYKKRHVVFEPGVTVLIGCNGSGKTTLIKQIRYQIDKENIPYVSFDNLHDGGSNARSKAGFFGDFGFLATSMCSSEGENISLNLQNISRQIGDMFKKNKDKNEFWIFLDAVDSGLSVDAIEDLKRGLFDTIFETTEGKEVYIIISANSYETARGEKCYDTIGCRYVSVKSYERYRNLVLKSRQQKNSRYPMEEEPKEEKGEE